MGKKSSPPPPPDYAKLATQQAELDKAAAAEQTTTNRPNQTTPWGESTWTQGENGQWDQNISLNAEDQALLDQNRQFQGQQQGIASGLLGRAGEMMGKPLDISGLPEMGGYDFDKLGAFGDIGMDPRGNSQDVQDAMMKLMAPDRQRSRDAEMQRLKNQGLPEDSVAFQRAAERLDQGDTDAGLKAMLAGKSEYANEFSRALQSAGFRNATRGQQFGEMGANAQLSGQRRQQGLAEQNMLRQSPMNDFNMLTRGINPGMPQMPSFMGGTGFGAANQMGAAKDSYQAAMDAFNADQAQSSGMMSGLFGLGGAMLGGPAGSMGAKIGSKLFGA